MYCHQCKVCKHLEIVVISKKKVMEAAQTGRSRAAVAVVAVAAAATTALWWNPAIPTRQMNPHYFEFLILKKALPRHSRLWKLDFKGFTTYDMCVCVGSTAQQSILVFCIDLCHIWLNSSLPKSSMRFCSGSTVIEVPPKNGHWVRSHFQHIMRMDFQKIVYYFDLIVNSL